MIISPVMKVVGQKNPRKKKNKKKNKTNQDNVEDLALNTVMNTIFILSIWTDRSEEIALYKKGVISNLKGECNININYISH